MPSTSTKSSRAQFEARLRRDRPDVGAAAAQILTWARSNRLLLRWKSGREMDSMMGFFQLGVQEHKVLTLQTNGLVWVLFDQMESRLPVSDAAERMRFMRELRARLLALPKADHKATASGVQASFRLEDLQNVGQTAALLETLEWAMSSIAAYFEEFIAESRRRRGLE